MSAVLNQLTLQICGWEKRFLRSVDVAYVKNICFNHISLLSDYCFPRCFFGTASGNKRRISEALPEALPKQMCFKQYQNTNKY